MKPYKLFSVFITICLISRLQIVNRFVLYLAPLTTLLIYIKTLFPLLTELSCHSLYYRRHQSRENQTNTPSSPNWLNHFLLGSRDLTRTTLIFFAKSRGLISSDSIWWWRFREILILPIWRPGEHDLIQWSPPVLRSKYLTLSIRTLDIYQSRFYFISSGLKGLNSKLL